MTSLVACCVVLGVLLPTPAAAAGTGWASILPTTGDVTVPVGDTVTLDTDLDLRVLRIDGTVVCAAGTTTVVRAEAIHVRPGGELRCGTPTSRFSGRLVIELDGDTSTNHVGVGARSLRVDGTLSLSGEGRGSSRRALARTAAAGATTLRLDDATGLRPGDELVVTSTDFVQEHDERVTVTEVAGSTVGITPALQRSHHCATESHGGRSLRVCAAVGLLTRNIVVQGPADASTSRMGGQVVATGDGVLRLDGVELRRMGQTGRMGRYPVHWHHVGDGSDSFVRDSSIVDAHNRFITIHGTDGVEVSGTVGANTVGHGFYLEDGAETGNTFVGNLGTGVLRASEAEALTPSDVDAAVFWISNPDNTLVDNVAVGGFAGFSLSFPDVPVGMSAAEPDRPRTTPLGAFRGNVASGAHFAGLFVDGGERPDRSTGVTWYAPRVDPADASSAPVTPVIEDFTAFKTRQYGIWVRTHSGADVVGARIADTWRGIYLANVQTDGNGTWGLVRDSLVVGESSNVGSGHDWETLGPGGRPAPKHWDRGATISGVQVYDGPMEVRDTVLAGFVPRDDRGAGGIGVQSPNDHSLDTRNRVRGLTFVDANRVTFGQPGPDGDDVTLLHDLDGSLTGTAGATVTTRGALLDDAGCAQRSDWRASVCTSGRWAGLYVMRRDGGDADVRVTRVRDGRSATFTGDDMTKPSLRIEELHQLSFLSGDDRVGKLQVMVGDRSAPGPVDITVPHPGDDPVITFWDGTRTPPMASSPTALRTSTQGWYFDAAARRLHLRIAGRGVTVHGPTSLPPPTEPPPPTTTQPPPPTTQLPPPTSTAPPAVVFDDVAVDNVHAEDIRRLAAAGVTRGCGPSSYCPDAPVTRAQMASFLVRALRAPAQAHPSFDDVGPANVHRTDIATLAAVGITRGCGSAARYCPDAPVTRAQMASFLVRARGLPGAPLGAFADVSAANVHRHDIAALEAAGVTRGCGPSSYCPVAPVTRAQMASFLVRAFDL